MEESGGKPPRVSVYYGITNPLHALAPGPSCSHSGVSFEEDTIVTLSTSRPWFVPGLAAFLLLALVPPAPLRAQTLGTWGPGEKPSPNFEVGGNPETKHGSPDGGYIRSLSPAPGVMG